MVVTLSLVRAPTRGAGLFGAEDAEDERHESRSGLVSGRHRKECLPWL